MDYNKNFPMAQLRHNWGVSIMVTCEDFDTSMNNGSEIHEITDSCTVATIEDVRIHLNPRETD